MSQQPDQPASGQASISGNVTGSVVGSNTGSITSNYYIGDQQRSIPVRFSIPDPVGDFTGRADEANTLEQHIRAHTRRGTTAGICGLRGMGGIGKTQLALHVARRVADLFPDGRVLIDLRGASEVPIRSEDALATIIRAFEPQANNLPDDLAALRALYQQILHDRRVLILADDARDGSQLDPLRPPAGCALLITSRNFVQLPGMAAPLELHKLSETEAVALIRAICTRLDEPRATQLAALCGLLPLALRISASYLVKPNRPIDRYLRDLADERTRLQKLHDPGMSLDVAASLNLSYRALAGQAEVDQAQMYFRQLGVFAAPFDRQAAQAILDLPQDRADALLDTLFDRSLLDYDEPTDRYSLHDLVRLFAANTLHSEIEHEATWLRYIIHYLTQVRIAEALFQSGGEDITRGLALFDRERAHVDDLWRWAIGVSGEDLSDHALLALADATVYVGDLRYGKRAERIPQLEAARGAAQRLTRKDAEGRFLGNLGLAYYALGDARQAITFHQQQLVIVRDIGDRHGEGNALGNLGLAYAALGDARQAITFYQQYLDITRDIGDRRGEGTALGNLGIAYAALGDARQAITYHQQNLAITREIGDRRGEGNALGNLGIAYYALGDAHQAITYHEQALVISREIGDRRGEGTALGNLGIAYYALGDARQAITYHEQAAAIFEQIGDRRAAGSILGNLGSAYADLGETDRAIDSYRQHITIARQIGDRQGEANSSWNFGDELVERGQLAEGIALMQVRVDFLTEIGHPDAEKAAAIVEQLRQQIAQGEPPPEA